MQYVPYENGEFRTASPASQGISCQAILNFLTELDRQSVDIQSLYIFRSGYQLLGANRAPYTGKSLRRIYSAAKALTGLAVLFAIQEEKVTLDTRLTDIFPDDMPAVVTERMRAMTVYHLLTMTTGHDRDTFRPVLNGANSVCAFLEEPLDYEPGTHFLYNNGVPHILGMIVEKVTGENYVDYLRPRFLTPLEIYCTVERTERGELEGSRTVCTADGFAKLSLFYLQEGCWNGKQLLSPELVRTACAYQVPSGRCSSISFMHTDQFAGYGFQLWRNSTEGCRLDGGRSQFGFLFPDKELAIVCNSIEEDSGLIPAILWNTLYPAILPPSQAAEAQAQNGEQELRWYLERWNCAPVLAASPDYRDDYYGAWFDLEENPWGLTGLSLSADSDQPEIRLCAKSGRYTVRCGLNGEWIENDAFPPMPRENDRLNQIFGIDCPKYRVTGGWSSDFCFTFQVRATDWMDYHTFYCRFNGERLSLRVESNLERMTHLRNRIPMKPREYSDAPVEGRRRH
ncbi:MAG: beta-lactamase family protein [Oscillospiraceae bacterium]|nr:beta-lactamase family protein [Oscillospiraceae bacterium]